MWSWLTGEPKKSARLLEAERTLGADQVHIIYQQLEQAAGTLEKPTSHLRGVTLSDEVFLQQLCGLPPHEHLAHSLAAAVKGSTEHEARICLESIMIFKVKLEYSGADDTREVCFSLLHGAVASADTPLSLQQLQQAIASALRIVLKCDAPTSVVDAMAAGATHQGSGGDTFTLAGYTKWCKVFPAVHQVLRNLMHQVGKLPTPHDTPAPHMAMPELIVPPNRAPSKTMLQPAWAWALRNCLPEECRHTWYLLFNSQRDGQSFSTLISRLGECAPTLILIQDKAGHLFGGYASQPWQRKGSFYGDSGCFIFGLLPKLVVYPATGINDNFQWCGTNFSQLPNGVGLGGQVGHYGVYIDDTLDRGISRPIATFANECLASSQTFEVDSVECWLVKPPEEDADGGFLSADNTVLDRNKEARNFMELAGVKVNHSEGLNNEPPPELML